MILTRTGLSLVANNGCPVKVLEIGVLIAIVVLQPRYSEASEYISAQHGLPCKQCHANIPSLNEFGKSFKNSRYSPEKKTPTQKGQIRSPESTAAKLISPGLPNSKEAAAGSNSADPAVEASQETPQITEPLYRSKSHAGTYVFTDNPLTSRETIPSEKNVKSSDRKPGMPAKEKQLTPAIAAKTNKKKISDQKKAAGTRHSRRVPDQPLPVDKNTRPLTYEDCVIGILSKSGKASSAKEAMKQYEVARHRCSPDSPLQ